MTIMYNHNTIIIIFYLCTYFNKGELFIILHIIFRSTILNIATKYSFAVESKIINKYPLYQVT